MVYRFAQDRQDYGDFAAGKVFYGLPGHPAFPVRLASEIFQRCLAFRADQRLCTIYDPCCGGAYLLSTLTYLHWDLISRVIASDIDHQVLPTADSNLALLTVDGLQKRIDQLTHLLNLYGKPSHQEALDSAQRLIGNLKAHTNTPAVRLFEADALNAADLANLLSGEQIDIVITDVPYGNHSAWHSDILTEPIRQMLGSLRPLLTEQSVVAICADKQQKVAHDAYSRLDRFQIGKRRIVILQPN